MWILLWDFKWAAWLKLFAQFKQQSSPIILVERELHLTDKKARPVLLQHRHHLPAPPQPHVGAEGEAAQQVRRENIWTATEKYLNCDRKIFEYTGGKRDS